MANDGINLHPLKLKSIQQILDEKDEKQPFFIPAYQRGYRWKPRDVKLLIDDLVLFREEEEHKQEKDRCPFYSIQMLVIKDDVANSRLEVIDGQQRLTTVLILLQALYVIRGKGFLPVMLEIGQKDRLVDPDLFSIQYETREGSGKWLADITEAYFLDKKNGGSACSDRLKSKNSDYFHFVDAFAVAASILDNWHDEEKRNDFAKTLKQKTKFIWYDTTRAGDGVSDNEVDIFNRLNATKIDLNNAELIKALFLQEDIYKGKGGKNDLFHEKDQLAIDWDNLEKQLQNPSLWYFMFPLNYPYEYETRIEYLLDLIKGKTEADKDDYYYTFNKYYTDYLNSADKLQFVREAWKVIEKEFLLLQEWYNDKCCYHYIGYLLEYGKTADGKPMTIPCLEKELADLKKDDRERRLVGMIEKSVEGITGNRLVHGNKEMTQALFLFNVELDLRRQNSASRFSFSEYKTIAKSIGWDQEHVASRVDYEPTPEKRVELAGDLLEYFTGVVYEVDFDKYEKKVTKDLPKDPRARELCKNLLTFFKKELDPKDMNKVYDDILSYFEAEDKFKERLKDGRKTVHEKDFIWNFVLLNSSTNRSYGNHIFPVKRRRIQKDDNTIYTPTGTHAVFEKAYSSKLTNMMAWGRNDAISYWKTIQKTIGRFFKGGLSLPSYIIID